MPTKTETLKRLAKYKAMPLCSFMPSTNVHTGEKKFLRWLVSWTIIRALWGGNRTGKTETGGFLFTCLCLGESLTPYLPYMTAEARVVAEECIRKGSRNGWAASVSYGLQPFGNQEKILRYLPKEEIAAVAYLRRAENIISQITLKNGRTINFKSYEQGREDFQAAGVGVVWCDEEPPKDIWQEIGLRQEAGVTLYRILTMTPVQGMTWAYRDIHLSKSLNITQETVGWDDNQYLTEEQKLEMAEGLSLDELEMRRLGKFVKKEGRVYKLFDLSLHTVPADFEPEIGRHVIYRAMDFGFAMDHPFVCLFIAMDTDGDCVIYDELYLRETGQEDTVSAILGKTKPFKARGSWGDSARPDWIDYLSKHGVPTQKSIKDVELGIAKVTEWLTPHSQTGKPRLKISMRCTELLDQLNNYVYPKKQNLEDNGRRLPEKQFDDGPDALRYFVMTYGDNTGTVGEARIYGHGDSVTGYGSRLSTNREEVTFGYKSKGSESYRISSKNY